MSKDPAVLFYTQDFLVGVMTMSDEQVGQYIRLLCLQHQKGHLTANDVKAICKDDDAVISKFCIDDDGLYYNERMDAEKENMEKAKSSSR